MPYLVHSGYELSLFLDGTKQFGCADHVYPPHRHEAEDLFDRSVTEGVLHKEVFVEPWNPPVKRKSGCISEGYRRVYYTRKGEEWRIAAWSLLWSAAGKQPWSEAAGFRAFPSMEDASLVFTLSDERPTGDAARRLMGPDAVALVRANVSGRLIRDILRDQAGPNYLVAVERVPELNRNIAGAIELIAYRNVTGALP